MIWPEIPGLKAVSHRDRSPRSLSLDLSRSAVIAADDSALPGGVWRQSKGAVDVGVISAVNLQGQPLFKLVERHDSVLLRIVVPAAADIAGRILAESARRPSSFQSAVRGDRTLPYSNLAKFENAKKAALPVLADKRWLYGIKFDG